MRSTRLDIEPARMCSWCGEWLSERDEERAERGAVISHGICIDCEDEKFGLQTGGTDGEDL